jgi:hypothetical protein
MTREEFNLLFHKAQVNLVAFKQTMDCYPELQEMVEMAIQQEREACAEIYAQFYWDAHWQAQKKAEVEAAVMAEREACAVVCDERAASAPLGSDEQCEAEDCAAAIRARGER